MATVKAAPSAGNVTDRPEHYGRRLGRVDGEDIINCGPIHIGITVYLLGVVPGQSGAYLCKGSRVWQYPRSFKRVVSRPPGRTDRERRRLWADARARAFLDIVDAPNQAKVTSGAVRRYHDIVHALVHGRMLDAGALGLRRTVSDYAHGVSHEWVEADLVTPRRPTIRHAVLTSLVLALENEKAAELIELAAMIEMSMPVVSRDAALRIYTHAATCLARLSPAWLMQGYALDWHAHGPIERAFRAHFCRMLNESWERDIPIESVAGIHLRELVTDAYEGLSAETDRELNGVEIPD